jgi:hypothetical protein
MPAFEFKQRWPQQSVIGRASHAGGFGNHSDKRRRVTLA